MHALIKYMHIVDDIDDILFEKSLHKELIKIDNMKYNYLKTSFFRPWAKFRARKNTRPQNNQAILSSYKII